MYSVHGQNGNFSQPATAHSGSPTTGSQLSKHVLSSLCIVDRVIIIISSIIEGFISLSNLPTVSKANKITLGSGFAMPGGTEVLNDMTSDDGGRKTRMLWLHNKLSVSANVAFYQRRLESDGWISTFVQDANRQAGGLIVKKGNTEMNITVTRVNGATQLLVIQTGV